MKEKCGNLLWVAVLLILAVPLLARDGNLSKQVIRETRRLEAPIPGGSDLRTLYDEAAVDTYCTVWYDFETMSWQGWLKRDNTSQGGTFWRVDDFAGLGGGSFGRLVPIEGTKSMWCGTRSGVGGASACSWRNPPGYGNNWWQRLISSGFLYTGFVRLSFHLVVDSEPEHDILKVQRGTRWDDFCWCTEFVDLESFSGVVDTVLTYTFDPDEPGTQIRFVFTSDSEVSDEDGLRDSDGGAIIDSITIADSLGLIDFENFESFAVGATYAGLWSGYSTYAYGTYSGVKSKLIDKDPCGTNLGTQIIFFLGSPNPSTGYPGLYDTPYCIGDLTEPTFCQNEMIYSPAIDLRRYSTAGNKTQDATIPSGDLAQMGRTLLGFDIYDDPSMSNLVFGTWFVRNIEDGCPGFWRTEGPLMKPAGLGYEARTIDLTDLVSSDSIQVAVGVVDLCDAWYPEGGDCGEHLPTPWYDNVRIQRVKTTGPQWSYYDYDLFQDNFPGQEFDLESWVRADAAIDINPSDNPIIRPGDSAVVGCYSILGGGIMEDPAGGPSVYLHAKCAYIGPAPVKPNLAGAGLQGNTGAYKSDDGVWTVFQCDTARTGAGIARNRYAVDFNDSLFTRGYMIEYYFTALDSAGVETALPRWARSGGPYFEFTCLPTQNGTVLFVDDSDGIGSFEGAAEEYWNRAWDALPAGNQPDRYDVKSPASGVSNGPGSRARNYQLAESYDVIIWDSGDLESVTISDGSAGSDKSNDCRMLVDWMSLSERNVGLWVCGDNVAGDLSVLASVPALTLMGALCGVTLVSDGYFNLTGGYTGGGVMSPLVEGDPEANIFTHGGMPDRFYAYGGCPVVNQFDVLDKTMNGARALDYPAYGGMSRYAGISSTGTNGAGASIRTMWFGFSYRYIRDVTSGTPQVRVHIARDVFNWMEVGCDSPGCDERLTPAVAPAAYRLAQNYPNPCNPSTTIKFDMMEKGLVTLRIYNVAGQLVRTLMNTIKDAGSYSVTWNGADDRGGAAASGIYFYKMQTGGFAAVKKLVLLR
jgi:hypothetical protein